MPSPTEIRTRYLLTAAEASAVTGAENLAVANPAADAAYAAIVAAVRVAGYDSFRITSGAVQVPDRLRGWSAGSGVLPTSWSSIGLDALVSTYTTARTLQVRRQNESDGISYLIAEVNGLLAHGIDKEPATAAADLTTMLAMLASIDASMAE